MGIDFWKLVLGWEPKIEAGEPYVEQILKIMS